MNVLDELNELACPLLGSRQFLERPAIVGDDKRWSWRAVHAAALALAADLPAGSTVCNLCDTRVGFLVVWLAALRRRCVQLLPPSGGRSDLLALMRSQPGLAVVVDDQQAVRPEWRSVARCLVWSPKPAPPAVADGAFDWSPDWQTEHVRLFTSGSTGTPEAHARSLEQLVRGARLLGARLAVELDMDLSTLSSLVCSVPPQHMFGLEVSVMLPLLYGVPVFDGQPLLPADVRASFQRCTGAVWVATPLHLRALKRASEDLPACRGVVASTMPLDAELAHAVERLSDAPVVEIYGSTETGAVATRRTARESQWRPLDGVRLESRMDVSAFWGLHFPSPRTLPDQTQADASGRFTLLGRQADVLKIAGRRASLGGLNQLLPEMPGLSDGVFYLPPGDAPGVRLVLIYAGEPIDRPRAESWLRERIDPVFMPRAFIRVDRIPRSGTGKVPRAALDQIYADWRQAGRGS